MSNIYWKKDDVLAALNSVSEKAFLGGKKISLEEAIIQLAKIDKVDFDDVSPKVLLERHKGYVRKPFMLSSTETEFISYQDVVTDILNQCTCKDQRVLNKDLVIKTLQQAPGITVYDANKLNNCVDKEEAINIVKNAPEPVRKSDIIKCLESINSSVEVKADCFTDNRSGQTIHCKDCKYYERKFFFYKGEENFHTGTCTRPFTFIVTKKDRNGNPVEAKWNVPPYFYCKYGEHDDEEMPERQIPD